MAKKRPNTTKSTSKHKKAHETDISEFLKLVNISRSKPSSRKCRKCK